MDFAASKKTARYQIPINPVAKESRIMMLTNTDIIFKRYLSGKITACKVIDSSHCETDKRFTYILDTDIGEHIAVKFSNNCFTTPERIRAWKYLASLYNKTGVYAPNILCDKNGCIYNEHIENNDRFIVYAEEKMVYREPKEFGINAGVVSLYLEDMIKATAKIAKQSTFLPEFPSAWCIYDKFCDDDETDETYYWQYEFYKFILEKAPDFRKRAERIWNRFTEFYESFQTQYRALPQAFFQGDIGNALLDENKKFVGVFDFNIAGTETILNYFFREFCRVHIDKNEIDRLNDADFLCGKDKDMRTRLDIIKKYYPFSIAEAAAFPTYYNMVYPLECDVCQTFQRVIREGNSRRTGFILDWIEYQQTRNDIFL